MRFIKKQFSLWRIVLIIGVAAIAIPIAARVSPTAIAVVEERQQANADNEEADAKHSKDNKAAVGEGVARPQDDDYYDRRRRYWEKRVERRLDDENLDEQTGDDDEDADAKDSKSAKDKDKNKDKDSKAAADDEDDADDNVDREIERRREYWRKRLDREW
jgi:hypothetical protein